MSDITKYEIGLYVSGKFRQSLGYTAKKTNQSLLTYAKKNGALIMGLLTDSELDREYTISKSAGFRLGKVTVDFTGYTLKNPRG